MSGDIYVARGGAVVVLGDKRIVLQEGQTVRAGHPLMRGREHLFAPFTVDFEYDGQADDAADTENPPSQDDGTGRIEQPDDPQHAGDPGAAEQPQVDAKAVRAWAADAGLEVSPKGKLPAAVVEQYLAAQQEV